MQTSFAAMLRSFRIASGLTQDDLAERSGLSSRGIRLLEGGQRQSPRLETVRLLAGALQLDNSGHQQLLEAARPEVAQQRALTARSAYQDQPPGKGARTSTVPVPLTPTVGRSEVIGEISGLLLDNHARLVTITGPPGIGKTRVAIEVARNLSPEFPDGVSIVWLAPVTDVSLVLPRMCDVLGLNAGQQELTIDRVSAAIGTKRRLFVLDNMEHVLPAATLLPELLGRCPNLKILATSRSRLRVTGEQRVPLPSLSLPVATNAHTNGSVVRSESEDLFVQRAKAADPRFQPTDETARLVADICHRVDGLPLAIELAAGQLAKQSITELASRARHLLPVLEEGPRDQPERLQTMRKSLAWSYSLLSSAEQALLRRLSVFRGSFSLEAVNAVHCPGYEQGSAHRGREQTAALIGSLIEQNLVTQSIASGSDSRLLLLEVIREYAGEELVASGEEPAARTAHARYFAELARQNERYKWIPREDSLPAGFIRDLPNLREALAWLETSGDGDRMLELASALLGFWTTTYANLREGQGWLERANALGEDASPLSRSKGLLAAGQVDYYLGNLQRANEEYAMALQEAITSGDSFQIASTSSASAAMAVFRGEYQVARELCAQAQQAAGEVADTKLGQAIAIWIPGTLARAEHGLGNLNLADEQFRAASGQMRAFDHPRGLARVLGAWGTVAVEQEQLPLAQERYLEAATLAYRSGDEVFAAINLKLAAFASALAGDLERAARLLGAVQAFERRSGPLVRLTSMDAQVERLAFSRLRDAMPATTLNELLQGGEELSLDQAIVEALAPSGAIPPDFAMLGEFPLTPRPYGPEFTP